jgi:hypothetical protein
MFPFVSKAVNINVAKLYEYLGIDVRKCNMARNLAKTQHNYISK